MRSASAQRPNDSYIWARNLVFQRRGMVGADVGFDDRERRLEHRDRLIDLPTEWEWTLALLRRISGWSGLTSPPAP